MSSWYSDSSPLMRRLRRTGARRRGVEEHVDLVAGVVERGRCAHRGGRPNRACSGAAQWWPTRTAMPRESRYCPTSWAWTPSRSNAARPTRSTRRSRRAGARRRSPQTLAQPALERALVGVHGIHPDARRGTARRRPAPIACDTGWVPASKRCGGGRYSVRSSVTLRDHRAAGEERRQRLEHVGPAVQPADAVRTEHLVTGEHREVDAERGQQTDDDDSQRSSSQCCRKRSMPEMITANSRGRVRRG